MLTVFIWFHWNINKFIDMNLFIIDDRKNDQIC